MRLEGLGAWAKSAAQKGGRPNGITIVPPSLLGANVRYATYDLTVAAPPRDVASAADPTGSL